MYKTKSKPIINSLNHHIHNTELYTHFDVAITTVHFHDFTL